MKKFTLIELLVVVAIIGILSSILLPSLSQAREKTKRAVCLSNERQISLSLLNYTIDDNGYYPTMHNETGVARNGWSFDDLLSYYDGRDAFTDNQKNLWGFAVGTEVEQETQVYRCPSDKRGNESSLSGWIARSYSMNMIYDPPGWGGRGVTNRAWIESAANMVSLRNGQIDRASESIILIDSHSENNTIGHLGGATAATKTLRDQMSNQSYWGHDQWKTNFLFADGHAQYLSFMQTYASTGKNAWGNTDVRDTMWDCMK